MCDIVLWGDNQVWPHILGMSLTLWAFTHCKAQGEHYHELKHMQIMMQRGGEGSYAYSLRMGGILCLHSMSRVSLQQSYSRIVVDGTL